MDKERVLVVEDEEVIRHVLSTLLSGYECEVVQAGSSEEAMPLLEGAPIAVALVDIVLPGVNGIEMLKKIKQLSPDTEVIIMTSHASVKTATEALRLGAYDYILKPFEELDEVWEVVKRALEKKNLTSQNRELIQDLGKRNQELQEAVNRRDSLVEAGRAMNGIYDLPVLLDVLMEIVVRELDVNRASLMLLDEENQELRIASARGMSEELVKSTLLKVGDGIAGEVARSGKPMLVRDAASDPRTEKELRPGLAPSFISAPMVVSIPILAKERVLGVINVTDRKSSVPFSEEDVAYLQALASQAAAAIERGEHVRDLERAIEDLKSTQEQLVSSERLKALGEMAAGVAHDFNNTLNGILLRAQMILVRGGVDPQSEDRTDLIMIEQLSLTGAETVKRLQDYARVRKDQPRGIVDLNEIVRTAVEITSTRWKQEAEAKGTRIEVVEEPGDAAPMIGSRGELVQMLSNLIFNAVEAMPQGGTVSIRTSLREGKNCLEVTDTGVGMPPGVQEKLFEPFFTTKGAGQGLGASIVYGIITRHSGTISVTSKEGQGTTFTMLLPATSSVGEETAPKPKNELEPVETVESSPAEGSPVPSVLFIEDETQNLNMYKAVMASAGFDVFGAEDGETGLAIFDREHIDVVVTDLSMPGMSGWEVAAAVKERNPAMPVILLSGWAVQEDQDKASEAGVDQLLAKPCPLPMLVDAVRAASLRAAA